MEPDWPRPTRNLVFDVVAGMWVVAAIVLAVAFWPEDGSPVSARFPSAILAVLCLLAATVVFAGGSGQ